MARPVRIVKSNYFILPLPWSAREIIDDIVQLGDKKYPVLTLKRFVDFIVEEFNSISKSMVENRLEYFEEKILLKKDSELLNKYINEKSPQRYILLLEYIALQMAKVKGDVVGMYESLEDNNEVDVSPGLEFALDYFTNEYFDRLIEEGKKYSDPADYEIDRNALDEIPLIIEGYEKYLSLTLDKGMGKKKAATQIESKIPVPNLRQEFDRHDIYFDRLGNAVGAEIPPSLRMKHLKSCWGFAQSVKE